MHLILETMFAMYSETKHVVHVILVGPKQIKVHKSRRQKNLAYRFFFLTYKTFIDEMNS